MNPVSLICPDIPPELLLASAHCPHLVRFYKPGGGSTDSVVAAASLAAAIQIASERLATAGVCVAEVVRDDQSGEISMLTDDSRPVVAISPSELLQPAIDRNVRRACVALERGELSSLAALFSPVRTSVPA
jgi:hypothetical protein